MRIDCSVYCTVSGAVIVELLFFFFRLLRFFLGLVDGVPVAELSESGSFGGPFRLSNAIFPRSRCFFGVWATCGVVVAETSTISGIASASSVFVIRK